VVLVIVSPLLRHFLLTLPFEAKLTLVAISPTIVTKKPHELRFRLGLGCSLGFSPLDFSTGFSSLGLSPGFSSLGLSTGSSSLGFSISFPRNTFPNVLVNLIGFWKSSVE
jgi:hypothetical protein